MPFFASFVPLCFPYHHIIIIWVAIVVLSIIRLFSFSHPFTGGTSLGRKKFSSQIGPSGFLIYEQKKKERKKRLCLLTCLFIWDVYH